MVVSSLLVLGEREKVKKLLGFGGRFFWLFEKVAIGDGQPALVRGSGPNVRGFAPNAYCTRGISIPLKLPTNVVLLRTSEASDLSWTIASDASFHIPPCAVGIAHWHITNLCAKLGSAHLRCGMRLGTTGELGLYQSLHCSGTTGTGIYPVFYTFLAWLIVLF